jgi:putative heme-binding domain-containing protein
MHAVSRVQFGIRGCGLVRNHLALAVLVGLCCFALDAVAQERLETQLESMPMQELIKTVDSDGDAQRGALLFYQANLNCAKCHEQSGKAKSLGPDLTLQREVTTDHLIKSILDPSETIHEGYETVVIQNEEGDTISGVLVERNDEKLTLVRIEKSNEPETFELDEIEWRPGKQSTMPEGLANQLADSQQFYDLVKYLRIIAADGPARAAQLRPSNAMVSLPPLPAYESQLDHRGLIGSWNQDSLKSGEQIFALHCASCHGTLESEGSMPTSLRFASGKFKNGNDPLSMYQTLTHGYGMMNAQRWMVPQQKYEVIHYIREHFLKQRNPSQYSKIDQAYLDSLPTGKTRGPKPASGEPWVQMDYGSSLMNTIEVSRDGSNIAQKGIVVRLDDGPGGVESGQHWMMYEHDTMRVAATWSGSFIDWNGIHFNGRHAVHPRVSGQVHFANSTGPGWGRPSDGSFVDNRVEGRDGKHYGPLARDWVRYRGMYRYANRSILRYDVGGTDVLESPSLAYLNESPMFSRHFNMGSRDKEMILQVTEVGDLSPVISNDGMAVTLQSVSDSRAQTKTDSANTAGKNWKLDGSVYAQQVDGSQFDMYESDFSIVARIRTTANGTIFCKTKNWAEWVRNGKSFFVRDGRLVYDIGWVGSVRSRRKVNDGKWHDVVMTWSAEEGDVTLYIDGKKDQSGPLRPEDSVEDHSVRIGYTNEDFPDPSFFQGQISGVRFYQRALAADELKAGNQVADEGLVANWNRVADAKLMDASGNQLDAEIIAGDERPTETAWGMRAAVSQLPEGSGFFVEDGNLRLKIAASDAPLNFTLAHTPIAQEDAPRPEIEVDQMSIDLRAFTQGGPKNYPEVLETQLIPGQDDGPFAVDVFPEPRENPWNCRVRLTGVDFLEDGNQALCSAWDGSIWHVSGIASDDGVLKWRRIAAGLFQPLGIKLRDGEIFVTCRDQLVRLHDLNGDGEMDWYESYNSDHEVTEHFHEFAMGLQTDDEGNFYYAKSARHALKAIVPHHGTLLKISRDGQTTEILANGFRAANGVCLNPDGTFYVTDQEGHWNPKNRINWVQKDGFYGNMFGYHDVTDASDSAMDPPMCWITNSFDRSPSELMWVESEKWGPLNGTLLNFSYGYGQVYVVPHETIDGQVQGGMCAFPLPRFPTGVMRGRFHPGDGQLYCCGMFAWAGDQKRPGGFYRLRYTGKPVHLPLGLNATDTGLRVRFSGQVDSESAVKAGNYRIKTWTIKRTAQYGSKHFDEKELAVKSVQLLEDGKTVVLEVPEIEPTRCMEIVYSIKTAEGERLEGKIHNTIHRLGQSH